MREHLLNILEEGTKKVIFNLKSVSYVDSAGLGELIGCKVTCVNRGAAIRLLHVHKRLYSLLDMVQLVGVFDMFDDEEAALKSFT